MAIPEEVEQSNGGAREQEEVDSQWRMRVRERTPSRFREKNDEIKNRKGGRREQRTSLIQQNTQGTNQGGYNRGTYQGQGSNSQPQQWNNAANRDSTTYQPKKRSLEEIVTSLAEDTERFSRDTNQRFNNVEASIKNLETQMGQIVDAVRKNEPGRFPSQSEQAKALTVLRSGRVLDTEVVRGQQKEGIRGSEEVSEKEAKAEEEVVVEAPKKTSVLHKSSDPYVPPPPYVPPIPFPGRLNRDKLSKAFKEIFDVLSKAEIWAESSGIHSR
ncbi:hypothetical protein LWI29_009446 [Acer saccharum]|uniref:Uncharacterized protein n=1 Tax=Acer saccharum TaxID=4024 RepID=A0AA39RCZ3_ACESA|nr:hypothetical protein LWI29_009446 [Acer saccharum]